MNIVNPDVYPMNWTWLTGRISDAQMRHEHIIEYERILEAEMKAEDAAGATEGKPARTEGTPRVHDSERSLRMRPSGEVPGRPWRLWEAEGGRMAGSEGRTEQAQGGESGPGRRQFLRTLSGAFLGIWALGGAGALAAYMRAPEEDHSSTDRIVRIGRLEDLRIGEARLVHGTVCRRSS